MRILLFTQYFWPENFAINRIALGLAERGVEVDVLTGMPNYPRGKFYPGYGGIVPRTDSYHGLSILRAPLIARGSSRLGLLANYLSFPVSAARVGRRLRGGYDWILVYAPSPATIGPAALSLKRHFGARLAYWVQDLWPESVVDAGHVRSRLILGPLERMVRRTYAGSDRLLIPSEGFRAALIEKGASPSSIWYLPNTVDEIYVPLDQATSGPERSDLPAAGFNIVYGGNIGESQDIETVLKAARIARKHPDIRWTFIGEGRKLAEAVELLRAWGLRDVVRFLGARSPESMPHYYALADALLVTLRPGSVLGLSVPSKLQAYLASGRPIIGAIDGPTVDIINEAGAGICVDAGSPEALATAALELRSLSPAAREVMASNARKYFEANFTLETVLNRLLDALGNDQK